MAAQLTDQTNYLPTRQVIGVFFGLSVAMCLAFLDQTIVATALPAISANLHGGRQSSWVATAYLLTSLSLTPLYGRWSDIFGRKPVLLVTLGIFWIGSLCCAVARTMVQLIIFRAIQGIGGGAIITMVLIIVGDIVSLKERGKYQGIIEATIALSNGLGPVLGGLFSEKTTWRWAFWINLPLGGLAAFLCVILLPMKPVEGNIKAKLLQIDYVGSALTVVSSILILLALNWGGVMYSWTSAPVLSTLIIGVFVMALFVVWESKWAKLPIVPTHIFRIRTVVGVYIVTLCNGMTFFAILYFIPQLLQVVHDRSAIESGLLLLPFLGPIAFVVFIAGQVVSRTSQYKPFMVVGFALWSVAQGLVSTLGKHSSNGRIAGSLLMAGVSAGGTFQTSLIAAQAAAPRSQMSIITGVRNFVRLLGSTMSLAICAAIINNSLRSHIASLGLTEDQIKDLFNDPTSINKPDFSLGHHAKQLIIEGYTQGFRRVFLITAGLCAFSCLVSIVVVEQQSLKRDDDAELKAESKMRLQNQKILKGGKEAETKNSSLIEMGPPLDDPSGEKDEDKKLEV